MDDRQRFVNRELFRSSKEYVMRKADLWETLNFQFRKAKTIRDR